MNRYLKYSLIVLIISIIGFAIYYFAIRSDEPKHTQHQKEGSGQTINSTSIENLLKRTDNFIVGNYKTTTPKDTIINSEINLPGIVAYDPNSSVNIAARMSGRIERLYVNYKYQKVTKGQKLFDIYSPELLTEQQNFIYLITNDTENQSIIEASKQKLRLYGIIGN